MDRDAQDLIRLAQQGLAALLPVPGQQVGAHGRLVGDDGGEPGVGEGCDGGHMGFQVQAVRLTGLSHQVGHIDHGGLGQLDGLLELPQEEVRDGGGVEATGGEQDEVSAQECQDGLRQGLGIPGLQPEAGQGRVAGAYCGLASVGATGHVFGAEGDGHHRGGKQAAGSDQHARELPDGPDPVARDVCQSPQHQVAQGVSGEVALALEAVVQEVRQGGVLQRQGSEAVAQVPGGNAAQLLADAPGGAPVVGHGDDACKLPGIPATTGFALQGPEQRSKPGAAPKGHHPQGAVSIQVPRRARHG